MQILCLLDMITNNWLPFLLRSLLLLVVCNHSFEYRIAYAMSENQMLYYVLQKCVKNSSRTWFRFDWLCSVQEIAWTTSRVIIAYKFVMVLIAWMVILAANWLIAYLGDQHASPMILSSCTPAMRVVAEYHGVSLDECRDIYKYISFTAETE